MANKSTESEIIKMKKTLIGLASLITLIILLSPSFLGFSVFHLGHAIQVSTSLTAKLACSSKYMTELNDKQIIKDLSSYSPAVNLVTVDYNIQEKTVTADLYGLATSSAKYRKGVGCSLISEQYGAMEGVSLQSLPTVSALWPLGEETADVAPLIQQRTEQLLRADNEKGYNSRALLVIKDGVLIGEAYGPDVNKNTPLLGWSMAKSVTAMMLGILEFDGKVDTRSASLFKEWAEDERTELKLEQLLQMSSGLDFDETYAPGSDATHMLFTAGSASEVAMNSQLNKKPSTFFSYSSGTTNLLSRYISNTFGNEPQQVQNFVQSKLFEPLSMVNSEFEMDASGVMVGSSYLYASGRDWARLGLLMVNEGEINGKRILSKDWVAKAVQPNSSENDRRYGYQFWLNDGEQEMRWPSLPIDSYAMMGNRQQSVMMIPSENIVFVRLGWTSGDYPMEQNYNKLLDALSLNNND